MEKDGWHGRSWGGLRVRHSEDTPKEPEETSGDGVKAQRKRVPRFDGKYVDGSAKPDPDDPDYDSYDDYDDEDDEESYNKGTVVGAALHGPRLGGSGGYEGMDMDDEGVCFQSLQHGHEHW